MTQEHRSRIAYVAAKSMKYGSTTLFILASVITSVFKQNIPLSSMASTPTNIHWITGSQPFWIIMHSIILQTIITALTLQNNPLPNKINPNLTWSNKQSNQKLTTSPPLIQFIRKMEGGLNKALWGKTPNICLNTGLPLDYV